METCVNYTEPIESNSIKIGKYLLKNGYHLAYRMGIQASSPFKADYEDILYREPDCFIMEFFYWIISLFFPDRPLKAFIGVLWCPKLGSWSFDLYGKSRLLYAKQLLDNLCREFGVKINIHLVELNQELNLLV